MKEWYIQALLKELWIFAQISVPKITLTLLWSNDGRAFFRV